MGLGQTLTDPFKLLGVERPNAPAPTQTAGTKLVNPINLVMADLEAKKQAAPTDYLTKEQVLADPNKVKIIRDFMSTTADSIYSNKPDPTYGRTDVKTDEEAYDAYMTHMRWFNSNAAYTAKEAIDVYGAKDEDKVKYGEAYKLYDQIGNAASSEGFGGFLNATKDYVSGLVSDPTTYIGFGIGKIFSSRAATAASKEGIKLLAEQAVKNVTGELAAKGASKAAIKTANAEVVKAAAKVSAKKALALNFASSAALSSVQDVLYQNTMMEAGAQHDFSYAENIVGTLLGGGLASIPSSIHFKPIKGATGLEGAGEKINIARKARASSAGKKVAKDIQRQLIQNQVDWIKMANDGEELAKNPELRQAVFNWFTNKNDPNSFITMLQKNGADIRAEDANSFSESLVRFAEGMDDEARKEIDTAFEPFGVTFSQVTEVFAHVARQSGQNFKGLSDASKFMDAFQNVTISNKQASKGLIDGLGGNIEKEAVDKETLKYWQTVWKRALISTPATSITNIKGWGVMQAIKVPSQALQMASLYGLGKAKRMFNMEGGDLSIGQANALWKNMKYMTRIAVDPFTTVKGFSDLVDNAPKNIQRDIHHHFFQGVEMNKSPKDFGVNPERVGIRATEHYLKRAQQISFVHAQDVMTKAISGLSELDKQTRLHLGMGIDEVVNKNMVHEITDDMWDHATKMLQQDTFSETFGKMGGWRKNLGITQLAKQSQELSHNAAVGFIWPFGQFVNSMLAFTWRHSPFGLVESVSKIMAGERGLDIGEKLSRAIIGSTALGLTTIREAKKQEEGLQWYEERDADGSVQRVDNMFPLGLYNIMGRMLAAKFKGEPLDKQVWLDLGRQLAVPSALKDAGSFEFVKALGQYMQTEEDTDGSVATDLIGKVVESLGGIASGLTRPFDPLNDLAGAYLDAKGVVNTAAIDKRQAQGLDAVIEQASRYTNNFFSLILGQPDANGKRMFGEPKRSATQYGDIKSGNPVMASLGTPYEQTRTSINTLLGMVDKPPFRMDSFTSDPEYDDFVNRAIFPILDRKAKAMLADPMFINGSKTQKAKMVDKMLSYARTEVQTSLNSGLIGDEADRLAYQRNKLSVLSPNDIIEAKKSLGINHPVEDMSLYEIQQIQEWVKLNEKLMKGRFENN